MEESKKDKYKKFQTKKDTKVPKKDNNEFSGGEHKKSARHDKSYRKDEDLLKSRGRSVSRQPSKIRKEANSVRRDDSMGRTFDEVEARLGRKVKFEAGSPPSGTNTYLPNWGKRKDGSSGPC